MVQGLNRPDREARCLVKQWDNFTFNFTISLMNICSRWHRTSYRNLMNLFTIYQEYIFSAWLVLKTSVLPYLGWQPFEYKFPFLEVLLITAVTPNSDRFMHWTVSKQRNRGENTDLAVKRNWLQSPSRETIDGKRRIMEERISYTSSSFHNTINNELYKTWDLLCNYWFIPSAYCKLTDSYFRSFKFRGIYFQISLNCARPKNMSLLYLSALF
jgi:hypothetical protein